ncbi:hypothetical protein OZN62_08900 [Aurantiacibacter sp. MUD11]|uniref:hypothetical protein n=1 Tax=Aurantiacibacter sp. MUD11 TaxID=3003265 RepID=UPI0022AAC3AF|nr:hypothetical protein [Aurantiacibacter sp. MUD11]WAT17055.1 hypothetical protein OZN62_08900 [Aurantiacibacter sp. MUD11]
MDLLMRWLPEVLQLYFSARARAQGAAQMKYAEDCEHWGRECFYKFGEYATRDIYPIEHQVRTSFVPGVGAVRRSELRAAVEWKLIVGCARRGEVEETKVDPLSQSSWQGLLDSARNYGAKPRE